MTPTKLLTFFLLFSFYLALAYSVSPHIANGLYEGRSSDIIISPKTFVEDDSFMILNGVGEYKQSEIEDVRVADLVSHALGTQPLSQSSRSALPPIDPFNKPRANLLIAFDSLGENTISSIPAGQKLKIKKSVYPASLSSVLTTLASGETPSNHGIVGDSWQTGDGAEVEAFTTEGQPLLSNYADLLSQTHHGRSLTLSVSLHSNLAHAFAAHRQTFSTHPWNNLRTVYTRATKTISSESSSEDLSSEFGSMGINDLLDAVRSLQFVEVGDNQVTVTLPGQAPFEFSLDVKEDVELIMELGLAQKMIELVESSPTFQSLVNDEFPDSFALVYTSLRAIQRSSGLDSDKFRVAQALLQAQASNLLLLFNSIYSHRLASQLLFLGSPTKSPYAFIRDTVPQHLISKETFPHVFTSEESHERTCNGLKDALLGTEFEAHCVKGVRHLLTRDATDSNGDDMLYLQSILWLILVWLIAVYLIVNAMASINRGKDTMLYRSTTAVRHPHAQ